MNTNVDAKKEELKDLVCGMDVSTDSKYSYRYEDEDYYFCSEHCLVKFKQSPKEYLKKSDINYYCADKAVY